jgi:membrane-bound lytic murein transglycosylase B
MIKNVLLASLFTLQFIATPLLAADKDYVDLQQDNVVAFIDEMVEKHEFDREALSAILAKAEIKATIIKKISTPAERTLTWGEYRKIFITI